MDPVSALSDALGVAGLLLAAVALVAAGWTLGHRAEYYRPGDGTLAATDRAEDLAEQLALTRRVLVRVAEESASIPRSFGWGSAERFALLAPNVADAAAKAVADGPA